MFTFNIHGQADDLSLLEPLVRHLGHVEIAIDYTNGPQPTPARQPHPVVHAIEEADRAEREAKKRQVNAHLRTLERKRAVARDRKAMIREEQKVLTPQVIDAVACPVCKAQVGQPCHSPGGKTTFGRTGHTHLERRDRFTRLHPSGFVKPIEGPPAENQRPS